MVWHLKPEKIGTEPGLQFVLVTFEGWADKGLTGPLYEREEPVNKYFIDTMKPMLYVLDLGTKENPFTNTAGYAKKALAFRVTRGDLISLATFRTPMALLAWRKLKPGCRKNSFPT